METELFFQYLQTEKRCSPHTVRAYKIDISQFFKFISFQYQITEIREVQFAMIRSWIVSLMDQGISSRSIKRKISSLKALFRYFVREHFITENPTIKVIIPKSSSALPVFVDTKGMNNLLDEIDFEQGFRGVRNKLILEMFYLTGIRLSELIELDRNSINVEQQQIKVLGKGNKERIIPVTKELIQSILGYYEIRKKELIEFEAINFVFITERGNKLYEKLVYRMVNSYIGKVSTISKKSPHVLRHTFATQMLNNGANLNTIKEILGHSNLAATQIYTHNTLEKLKLIYEQAHPRA